jgi:hypothetical protein
MDPYSTHLPVLTAAICRTAKGPVLELGCGYYSTPVLHEICAVQNRILISADNDKSWLEKFEYMQSEKHQFYCPADWTKLEVIDVYRWSVVFIDHHPPLRRKIDIERLQNNADFLVIHDTENPIYHYEQVLAAFKYRFDYKKLHPWTTVVSQFYPPAELLEGL